MEFSDPITERSLNELVSIFSWANEKREKRRTVLIGGWAVYLYNPYFGSIDIDLVTSSRTRNRLTFFLRKNRGFEFRRRPLFDDRKLSLELDRWIIDVDFGTFENEDLFEGTGVYLKLNQLKNRTSIKSVSGVDIEIPDKSMLLILKTKAAWDRSSRLNLNTSFDPDWDRSKLTKDKSDLIALIDCEDVFDVGYLGNFFENHDFLKQIIADLEDSTESIKKYGKDEVQIKKTIRRFRSTIF